MTLGGPVTDRRCLFLRVRLVPAELLHAVLDLSPLQNFFALRTYEVDFIFVVLLVLDLTPFHERSSDLEARHSPCNRFEFDIQSLTVNKASAYPHNVRVHPSFPQLMQDGRKRYATVTLALLVSSFL